jgi:hypothetical protein
VKESYEWVKTHTEEIMKIWKIVSYVPGKLVEGAQGVSGFIGDTIAKDEIQQQEMEYLASHPEGASAKQNPMMRAERFVTDSTVGKMLKSQVNAVTGGPAAPANTYAVGPIHLETHVHNDLEKNSHVIKKTFHGEKKKANARAKAMTPRSGQ